jgi:hypothetical protein
MKYYQWYQMNWSHTPIAPYSVNRTSDVRQTSLYVNWITWTFLTTIRWSGIGTNTLNRNSICTLQFNYATDHTWHCPISTCTTTNWKIRPIWPITIRWTWLCRIASGNIYRRASAITAAVLWQWVSTRSTMKK